MQRWPIYSAEHVGKSRAERSGAAIVEAGSWPKILIVGFYYKHLFALSYSLPQQINTLKRGTFPKRRQRHRGVLLPYFPRPLADCADIFCVLYLNTAQKKKKTLCKSPTMIWLQKGIFWGVFVYSFGQNNQLKWRQRGFSGLVIVADTFSQSID